MLSAFDLTFRQERALYKCAIIIIIIIIIKDWAHCVGHCPAFEIFWQITCSESIMALPPAGTSSAGMLSMPAAFLFFRNFTASFTSSLRTRKLSMSVVREVLSFFMSPVARYECRSAAYYVHLLKMSLDSVTHFPFLSRMVLSRPCLLLVSPFTTWYAFLALFASRFCSMSLH